VRETAGPGVDPNATGAWHAARPETGSLRTA
jgi:hypothetical protein